MSVISLVSFYTPRRSAPGPGNKGALLPFPCPSAASPRPAACGAARSKCRPARRLVDSVSDAIVAARLPRRRTDRRFICISLIFNFPPSESTDTFADASSVREKFLRYPFSITEPEWLILCGGFSPLLFFYPPPLPPCAQTSIRF